ncbi:sex peptide receptor [Penaeus vannamei]|nr:sex peptide receptor-like [Penaeus vannamei]
MLSVLDMSESPGYSFAMENYTIDILDNNDDNESYTLYNETYGNLSCSSNDSVFYINVTQQYPLELAMPLYGYAMPVLFLVTTIANTLILAVLGQRHMRSPTNAVLMAMALSDMLTVLFPEPMFFYMYTLNNHPKPLSPPSACNAWTIMHETIPNLFHTASIWLTVVLAVQRYIYVCHASLARVWCTLPRVMKVIAFIFVLATIHQAPRLFDTVYTPMMIESDEECVEVCVMSYSSWVTDLLTLDFYFSCYYIFRVIFVHLGPCLVLVILNVLLYRAMRQAQKRRQKLFKENDKKKECKKLRDDCTTLMLIVVVTVFLITEIPLAVITFLHVLSAKEIVQVFSEESYHIVHYFFIISNSFIIFSYPFNFAIYCGMSRQFRETFRDLFIRGRRMPRRDDSTRYSMINGPPKTCSTEV